jgi:hypothetical protein
VKRRALLKGLIGSTGIASIPTLGNGLSVQAQPPSSQGGAGTPGIKTVPILDWHGIWPGYVNYDTEGNYFPQDLPRGVRLSVQPAEISAPVLRGERKWEAGNIHYLSLALVDGRYRLWYMVYLRPDDPAVKAGRITGPYNAIWCYAESRDGFRWERPELGLYDYDGSRANNILMACGDPVPYVYFHVMVDPAGKPEERYKATSVAGEFYLDGKAVAPEEGRRLWKRRQAAGDAEDLGRRLTSKSVITAAVSADGIHWKHLAEPIARPPWLLDTQNILAYDPDIKKYLLYLRSHRARRRAVSRYEATDFRGPWENHVMVLTAEPDDPPDWDIYAPCYCRHPRGAHLMFFNPYQRASDLQEVHLAISHDGVTWVRPERRRPVIPRSERYGAFYPAPELVPLGEDRWGLLTLGVPYPHNKFAAEFAKPQEYFWATWKRDRLVALEADDYGEVALTEQPCAGEQLHLNLKTLQPGSFVKVEIVDGSLPDRARAALRPALAGYAFDDCEAVSGDHLAAVVRWKGKSDLSALRGKKIHLRLRMARAKLFAVTL